jgi:hypothetical protein
MKLFAQPKALHESGGTSLIGFRLPPRSLSIVPLVLSIGVAALLLVPVSSVRIVGSDNVNAPLSRDPGASSFSLPTVTHGASPQSTRSSAAMPAITSPLRAGPSPHYVSCGPNTPCNLNGLCVTASGLEISPSSGQATLSWSDAGTEQGLSFSNFIMYGTNPSSLAGPFAEGSASATITGLASNIVYYVVAGATRQCGQNTYGSSVSNCFYVTSTSGGVCPFGVMGITASASPISPAYTSVSFTYSITPTTLVGGGTPTVSIWSNGQTSFPTSSPAVIGGFQANEGYTYYVNVTAPGYVGASFESTFGTGCTDSSLSGAVTILGSVPPTGVTGANIDQGGSTYVAISSAGGGSWLWSLGCLSSSYAYSLTASAIGYSESGTDQGTLQPSTSASNVNFAVPIWSTSDADHAFQDMNSAYSTIATSYVSSVNARAYSAGEVSGLTSSSFPPTPPSGSTTVLQLSGTDTSTTGSPHSQVIYSLGNIPNPYTTSGPGPSLSGPVELSFAVFVPDPGNPNHPSLNSHFSVDATISGGGTLHQSIESTGAPVLSSLGSDCWAADLTYTVDVWQTMYCDLSSMNPVTLSQYQLVYDNNNAGTGGPFYAYFDSISLINPSYSDTIVNGGFEEPGGPFGWQVGGSAKVVSSPVETGNQSLRVGSPNSTGDSGSKSFVLQEFRVPNTNLSTLWPTLQFYYQTPSPSCSTGCQNPGSWVEVNLIDYTLGIPVSVLDVNTQWASTWSQHQFSLQQYEGHIVDFEIETFASPNFQLFAYFDDIQVVLQGLSLSEKQGTTASGHATGTLTFSGSVFRNSCYPVNSNTVYNAPIAFASANSKWASINPPEGGSYPAEGNVSLTANIWNFTNYCTGTHQGEDVLYMDLSVAANATGEVYYGGTPEGVTGIQDFCVLTKFSAGTGSDSAASPVYAPLATLGLVNGPPQGDPALIENSPDLLEFMSGAGIVGEVVVAVGEYGLEGFFSPELIFAIGADLAFELLVHFAYAPTINSGSCSSPPSGFTTQAKWDPNFDSNGELPTFVRATGSLQVFVGCNGSSCHGGTYTLSLETIADTCLLYAPNQCNATLFESVNTLYTMTLVTT